MVCIHLEEIAESVPVRVSIPPGASESVFFELYEEFYDGDDWVALETRRFAQFSENLRM